MFKFGCESIHLHSRYFHKKFFINSTGKWSNSAVQNLVDNDFNQVIKISILIKQIEITCQMIGYKEINTVSFLCYSCQRWKT